MKKHIKNKDINILIVDDEKSARFFLAEALKDQEYNIDLAEDGYIGFEKSVKNKYDIILMDIKMPNMNGIEAIEAIKQVDPRPVIIIISAFLGAYEIKKAKKLGVFKCLYKPIKLKELLNTIQSAIKERKKND